jgi:protein-S-isoprenylcysteine O-methyltransferase Ste14
MNLGALVFRLRVPIFVLLYVLGFLLPFGRGTLWLGASTLLARTHWMDLGAATLVVTIAALASLAAGAALRVWGTAYLGSRTMSGLALQGDVLTAAGPYRHSRNPLYLGSWLLALGVSILMPPGSALCFLAAFTLFVLFLIYTEERFLLSSQGDAYRQYLGSVPRILPRPRSALPASPARPHWLPALLAETYSVAITLCFAVLAWRYNAHLLMRCVMICYGASLVIRALARPSGPDGKPNWF